MSIQWLFVGGPRHGDTLWIKHGSSVRLSDGTVYQGQNFLFNGRLYRIGVVDPNAAQPSAVAQLLRDKQVQHIAGS